MLATWSGYGGGPGPWVLVFPLFWLAVIIGIVLWSRGRRGRWFTRSGEAALAESFARGEITDEEYRRRRDVLRERAR